MNIIKYILFMSIIISMSGCGSGNSNSSNIQNDTGLSDINDSKILSGISDSKIPVIDLLVTTSSSSCPYNASNPLIYCSSSGSVCAQLILCPSATYATGLDANNYFVTDEIPLTGGTFKLILKGKVSKSFHLDTVYNDLKGNSPVGKISQIDTSKCDVMISSANYNPGASCNIDFMYQGLETNQLPNEVHMLFKSEEDSESLDFHFNISNSVYTNQNVPIINQISSLDVAGGSTYLFSSPTERNNSTIEYSNSYSVQLQNSGGGNLTSSDQSADLMISIGSRFNGGLNNLYFQDYNSQTTCGNRSVLPYDSCFFNFSNAEQFESSVIKSSYGRFVYQYDSSSGNPIRYTHNSIIGVGDIMPSNYTFSRTTQNPTIELEKVLLGNDNIEYMLPIETVTFNLRYDPLFEIQTISNDSQLLYSYGRYNNKSASDYLSQIKLEYDPKCFGRGYTESSDDQKCKVRLSADDIPTLNTKPITFQLYATYLSPVNHKTIEEFIGNITYDLTLPAGDYMNNCQNVTWTGKILSADCRSWDSSQPEGHEQFKHKTLAYTDLCSEGSSVSSDPYSSGYNWDYGDLHCDAPKEKIVLPDGDYRDNCNSIKFDGTTLSALCTDLYRPQGTFSSLNYKNECAESSLVTIDGALHLQCITPLHPTTPKGSYQQSCNNISYENNILTAQCYSYSTGFRDLYKHTALNIYSECLKDSTVSNIGGQLMCDRPIIPYPKLEQPSGSYLSTPSDGCPQKAKNIAAWDGTVLKAECNFNGTVIDSSINYLKECADNATVSFSWGVLQCDATRNPMQKLQVFSRNSLRQ